MTDLPQTNDERRQQELAAMENCENIPIHDIGEIQSCGYLLAYDMTTERITHVSENLHSLFSLPANELLGTSIQSLFNKEQIHEFRNAASRNTYEHQRQAVGRIRSSSHDFLIFGHRRANLILLEFHLESELQTGNSVYIGVFSQLQQTLAQAALIKNVDTLMHVMVETLRELTGFDRVMTYQFLADGSGEVVSESCADGVDSFKGLRFPSYDIPQAARKLYASTPIRIIASIDAPSVKILSTANPEGDDPQPLDLSLTLFRGVVDVHRQYLQNMGVGASMSLPIMVDGELWGLFALHHRSEYFPTAERCGGAEIIGSHVSLLLGKLLQQRKNELQKDCTAMANQLFSQNDSLLGFTTHWQLVEPQIRSLIHCHGIALVGQDKISSSGDCLRPEAVHSLLKKVATEKSKEPITIESLADYLPPEMLKDQSSCGVLIIPIDVPGQRAIIFFRNTAATSLRWAGAPKKSIVEEEGYLRLLPRSSFQAYKDSTQYRCTPWSQQEVAIARSLQNAIKETMKQSQRHESHKEQLGLMIRELDHRVRNMLALIQSMVRQSGNSASDLKSFVDIFEQRISALAATHKILSQSPNDEVELHQLIETTLAPYIASENPSLHFEGVSIRLRSSLASMLSIVIHELLSNAMKYGSLSTSSGNAYLNWSIVENNLSDKSGKNSLLVEWKEIGGPRVIPPHRQGFGTSVIRDALVFEFDADTSLDFKPDGVEARFLIPLPDSDRRVRQTIKPEPEPDKGFSALILEDDFFIARETEWYLKECGASQIEICSSIEQCLSMLETQRPDFAVLDANIRGQFSGSIAEKLTQMGVPFCFATGYSEADFQLSEFECLGILSKPYGLADMRNMIKRSKLV